MKTTTAFIALPLLAAAVSCASAKSDNGSGGDVKPSTVASHPGPQPDFGPLVQQADPPPPISGGTLAVAPDGTTAVAADADRDRLYVVDLPTRAVTHTVILPLHSEPGRVTVGADGKAYVVLRSSGGVAVVDLATGDFTTLAACRTPRGVAIDNAKKSLYVACASGEFLTIDTTTGDATTQILSQDLRDVVVDSRGVHVTRFRTAEIGDVPTSINSARTSAPAFDGTNLMWRAMSLEVGPQACINCGQQAVVAQQPTPAPVDPAPGGYGGGGGIDQFGECGASGIITTRVGIPGKGSLLMPEAVLPVDLATDGHEIVVVAAGNGYTKDLPQLFIVYTEAFDQGDVGCQPVNHGNVDGQAIAAAFDGQDELIVQTREPEALAIMTPDRKKPWKTIALADDSRADTGHAIFHSNAGGFIACASCHAEGQEDGHVWQFDGLGPRRTPSLRGTIEGTQPYHWAGEMHDFNDLVTHVFVERMSGPKLDDTQTKVLQSWVNQLPELPPFALPSDASARGEAVFTQHCTACHTGEKRTNNQTVDVGTGGGFQVPSLLGVAWRPPYLHDGCAAALSDRFDPSCGGAGHAQDLTRDQVSDVIAFLQTL